MNRLMCLLCVLLAMLNMVGCNRTDPVEEPVMFYYPRAEFGVGETDSVISPEIREGSGLTVEMLLENYLEGPLEAELINPFPEGTKLISISLDSDTLHITLSDSVASLTGVDLTLACASLAKTCLAMTDAASVEILAETELLNGSASIVMDGTAVLVDEGAQHAQTTAPN